MPLNYYDIHLNYLLTILYHCMTLHSVVYIIQCTADSLTMCLSRTVNSFIISFLMLYFNTNTTIGVKSFIHYRGEKNPEARDHRVNQRCEGLDMTALFSSATTLTFIFALQHAKKCPSMLLKKRILQILLLSFILCLWISRN